MIAALNAAVDAVERQLAADPSIRVDVASLARGSGTTEYHLRRMFSSLAGMPLFVTATARPKRSVAPSEPCTAPDPAMFAATAGRYVPSPGSGSTSP